MTSGSHIKAQLHRLRAEEARIHLSQVRVDADVRPRLIDDVAQRIDPRSDFDQPQSVNFCAEDAALSDHKDFRPAFPRQPSIECHLVDAAHQLGVRPLPADFQLSVDNVDLQATGTKKPREYQLARVRRNVHEAADAGADVRPQ